MQVSAAPGRRWMYGPLPDLLIGCGGLYALGFGAFLFWHEEASAFGLGYLAPLAILAVSIPHYGATLIRVYETREQRRRYALFTVYTTSLLAAWFAVGTWNAIVGSIMITLYLSWSPWHYSGQNYGIALVFLGRAGVEVSQIAKRALRLSFVLSFVLAFLNLHAEQPAAYYAGGVGEHALGFLPLGLSDSFLLPVFTAAAVVYLGSLVVAGAALLRAGSARALLPAAMIVFSQSLWFVIPYAVIHLVRLDANSAGNNYLQASILWVAVAHGAQYLWITSFYARASSDWKGFGDYFGRIFLFSSVAWTLPVILFAPYALGGFTFGQGLMLLLSALVNLHHFVLDGAIWKLRNSRIASILIRDESEVATEPKPISASGGRRWALHLAYAVGVACVATRVLSTVGGDVALPIALERGDARVAAWVLDGGGWFGMDAAQDRVKLGDLLLQEGDRRSAIEEYWRATELSSDTPMAHYRLGHLLVEEDRLEEGISQLRQALAARPSFVLAQRALDDALVRRRARDRKAQSFGP